MKQNMKKNMMLQPQQTWEQASKEIDPEFQAIKERIKRLEQIGEEVEKLIRQKETVEKEFKQKIKTLRRVIKSKQPRMTINANTFHLTRILFYLEKVKSAKFKDISENCCISYSVAMNGVRFLNKSGLIKLENNYYTLC